MTNPSEDIVKLIKQGDTKAFESLFKEYYARLCDYSCLITKDKDASSEIVQDIFVQLWKNHTQTDIKYIKAYLFKATHNNSIKHNGKQGKFEVLDSDKEYGSVMPEDFELTQILEKSINELPPRCKEIFILSRIDKLRHSEIADKLGISSRTVEVQIRKANQILKEKLREFSILLFLLFFR